jgi:acyl carrier protein
MSQGNTLRDSIRSFVVKKFPAARKKEVRDETLLLESRIIDSLGILDVVTFLEQSFQIVVSDEELTPENFGTIAAVASFVESKRSQSPVAAR